jgi:hypothetical protein
VLAIYGHRLKKAILYGSYATGKATHNSDIDLMVVPADMESAFAEIDRLNDIKCNIGPDYEVYISTIPVSEDFFPNQIFRLLKMLSGRASKYERKCKGFS